MERSCHTKAQPLQMEVLSAINFKGIQLNAGHPFTIAKLVNTAPISMVYNTYNYSYWT
jgi:hypothetical protein